MAFTIGNLSFLLFLNHLLAYIDIGADLKQEEAEKREQEVQKRIEKVQARLLLQVNVLAIDFKLMQVLQKYSTSDGLSETAMYMGGPIV